MDFGYHIPLTLMIVLSFWHYLNKRHCVKIQQQHHLQPQITEHSVCKLLITVCAAVGLYMLCGLYENMVLCLLKW